MRTYFGSIRQACLTTMRTSSAHRSSASEASSRQPCPSWSPRTSTALGTCGRTCRACLHRKHTSEPRTALPKQYYRLAKGTDNMKKPTKATALYVGKLIRSEERRVGKKGVSTCRYRWCASHSNKQM